MTPVKNEVAMKQLGKQLVENFRGGEVIELVGDVGAGKTTLVKGMAEGLGVKDDVQSPSFTISRIYEGRDGTGLHHYDFYRLNDAGVMRYELAESVENPRVVTVIEWAETVQAVLPETRTIVHINYTPDGDGRELVIKYPPSQNEEPQ